MRDYILLFLKKQKQICVYDTKEQRGTLSYICKIWLDDENHVKSLFVIYTPIAIIGNIGNTSLFEYLGSLVQEHSSYEDAVLNALEPNMKNFRNQLSFTCDKLVQFVQDKGSLWNTENLDVRLLSFNCANMELCLFTMLYQEGDFTDYVVLNLASQNYIHYKYSKERLQLFLDKIFEGYLKIIVLTE